MKSRWETYKGKKFFYIDYARMPPNVFAEEIQAVTAELMRQPPNSALILVNVDGMVIGPRELDQFKNLTLQCRPYIHKTAVLGIRGPKKALLDIVVKFAGLHVTTFETAEEARDWLVG